MIVTSIYQQQKFFPIGQGCLHESYKVIKFKSFLMVSFVSVLVFHHLYSLDYHSSYQLFLTELLFILSLGLANQLRCKGINEVRMENEIRL